MTGNTDGFLGREVKFKFGAGDGPLVEIPGCKEKGISRQGQPVDVTSDEDGGWRELLGTIGMRSLDINISGVTRSDILHNAWHGGDATCFGTFEITYPNGRRLTGGCCLVNYEETGSVADAVAFTSQFQSTGAVTPYNAIL